MGGTGKLLARFIFDNQAYTTNHLGDVSNVTP